MNKYSQNDIINKFLTVITNLPTRIYRYDYDKFNRSYLTVLFYQVLQGQMLP
jgi:hypothetical protein